MRRLTRGFTLIELLIVIGVLGILAAGLLAAVDPFEQLKKGRDTNRRNVVVEYHNALIRYYATHGELPWNGTGCTLTGDPSGTALSGMSTCTTSLINDGELKEDFEAALGDDLGNILVTSPSDVAVYVCFAPESKSLFNDDATKYNQLGAIDATTCPTDGTKDTANIGSCYWCAK